MRDNNKEPKLTYALDSSDKMVHIGSVESDVRGLSLAILSCWIIRTSQSLLT